MGMYCTQCGASLPDDAVFCNRCGKRQSEQLPIGSIPDRQGKMRTTPTERSKPNYDLMESVTTGQPKKGRKSPLVLLCIVIALILVLIVGGIGIYSYNDQQNAFAQARMELAYATGQQFCNFLVQKDYQSAYNMLESGSWSSLSDFQSFMEKSIYTFHQHNYPQGFLHLEKCSVDITQHSGNEYFDIDGEFDFDDTSIQQFFIILQWDGAYNRFDVEISKNNFVY